MNDRQPREINNPREGYFKVRAYSRGPWVPCRIYRPVPIDPATGEIIDRWPHLVGERGGKDWDVTDIWHWGREIEREEWEWLTAIHAIRTKDGTRI